MTPLYCHSNLIPRNSLIDFPEIVETRTISKPSEPIESKTMKEYLELLKTTFLALIAQLSINKLMFTRYNKLDFATSHPQPVPRPTSPPRTVQVAAVRCFKCRKLGHMQSHCSEYQCPYCRKYAPGHYQKECLKRAIRMQNTRTTYARRRAFRSCSTSFYIP